MNEERIKRMESFTNSADFFAYLQDCEREDETILEVMRCRPKRKGDQLFRESFWFDGETLEYSIVHREDGSVEFWLRRYEEPRDEDFVSVDDDGLTATYRIDPTHAGYTLLTVLGRRDLEEPDIPPHSAEVAF